ncbi:MAG: hypothetical protein JXQ69_05345 [Paludibacteraceae bacterium]|nr:hypothetical protein [Paludibacteraceae bacterium]MBN2787736.1 hypothetical protein [Paludibacteraceae bacterium]
MKKLTTILYIALISMILFLGSCKSSHGGGSNCPGHGGYSQNSSTNQPLS